MSYETIQATRYRCTCEAVTKDGSVCGYKWEADSLPDKCVSCHRRTWNGKDKRHRGIKLEHNGKNLTIREWANAIGVAEMTIRQRLARGFATADALDPSKFMPGPKPKEAA